MSQSNDNGRNMNLLERLKEEINLYPEIFNYYKHEFNEPLVSLEEAKKFILEYFVKGSKKHVLLDWGNSAEKEISFRNGHCVNVFFIGGMLQRIIDPDIKISSETGDDYSFSYIWYLTCLAHDLGYVYELKKDLGIKKTCNDCILKKTFTAKDAYKCFELNIPYTNFEFDSYKSCFISKSKQRSFSCSGIERDWRENCHNQCRRKVQYKGKHDIEIVGTYYTKDIMENYFRYRLFGMGVLDHGIVGADAFLSRLIENYRIQFENNTDKGENIHNFWNRDQKHFCCEQFMVFRYIADCIASHNVFKVGNSRSDEERYLEYGLEGLCDAYFENISYKKNPLLFILCVADTLEPWKRFREYDNETVLRKIDIDYDVLTNTITVTMSKDLLETESGKRYRRDVEGLGDWCDVRAEVILSYGQNL